MESRSRLFLCVYSIMGIFIDYYFIFGLAGAALGTITLPVIGTVSYAFILATCGAATGYMSGYITGYNFGRILESNLGWN